MTTQNPHQSSAIEMPSNHDRTAMTNGRVTLTTRASLGLFFIQRYRFLTIDQFARASGLNRNTASHQLEVSLSPPAFWHGRNS
jgi:hypothetical protein